MRVIQDLVEFLTEKMPTTFDEVKVLIQEFEVQEQAKYTDMKKDNKLTFGKYRGYTPKELALTEKGKEYLSWLLTQDWVLEKRESLVVQIKELGIKKKSLKRTPLE